jgi:flagellar basal-body rod protein FlgC
MNPLFSIPVSGLNLQTKRLAVSASNVANLGSTGVRTDRAESAENGYVPHRVVGVTGPQGGVRGESRPIDPPSVQYYDPGAPDADEQGVVARPNVALEQEMVTQLQAKQAYKANLKVIETVDEMLGALLDIKS